jgi:nucleoside-diphosphate-sugar epimerase
LKWHNKEVLVTGGAGFIGSALTKRLVEIGANVTVFDNFDSGSTENLKDIKVKIVKGDIRDCAEIDHAMKGKDLVYHLAAKPFIPDCYINPRESYETNTSGTLNVALSSIKHKVDLLIHYSSSEVYGTALYVPMDEKHATNPVSSYSVSKLAAEKLVYALYFESGLPTVIIRQFNVYGEHDTHPRIIPTIISQLASGSHTLEIGNINVTRDFTYVSDAVEACIKVAETSGVVGETFNIGTGKEISIKQLAYLIADLMDVGNIEIRLESTKLRPIDVYKLCANAEKAKNILGWEPKVSLEEGLIKLIEWRKKNRWKFES